MLTILVPGTEYFNETEEVFQTVGDINLILEHSLVSLSKWESKHQKPFLAKDSKTPEEVFDYVECMIITKDYPNDLLYRLTQKNIDQIHDYIESKESATTFGLMPKHNGPGETITAELVYYWMVAFNIPFECENWHLNRLFALIRICNIKNSPPKKMGRHEIAARNRELNATRRAQYNTRG